MSPDPLNPPNVHCIGRNLVGTLLGLHHGLCHNTSRQGAFCVFGLVFGMETVPSTERIYYKYHKETMEVKVTE